MVMLCCIVIVGGFLIKWLFELFFKKFVKKFVYVVGLLKLYGCV